MVFKWIVEHDTMSCTPMSSMSFITPMSGNHNSNHDTNQGGYRTPVYILKILGLLPAVSPSPIGVHKCKKRLFDSNSEDEMPMLQWD